MYPTLRDPQSAQDHERLSATVIEGIVVSLGLCDRPNYPEECSQGDRGKIYRGKLLVFEFCIKLIYLLADQYLAKTTAGHEASVVLYVMVALFHDGPKEEKPKMFSKKAREFSGLLGKIVATIFRNRQELFKTKPSMADFGAAQVDLFYFCL
jgi:hypothetical protein